MKHDWIGASMRPEEELIAHFGEARILKHLDDGRLEIRGGTNAEQAQAHAWMKQFLLPTPVPGTLPAVHNAER